MVIFTRIVTTLLVIFLALLVACACLGAGKWPAATSTAPHGDHDHRESAGSVGITTEVSVEVAPPSASPPPLGNISITDWIVRRRRPEWHPAYFTQPSFIPLPLITGK